MATKLGEVFVDVGARLTNLKTGLDKARNESIKASTSIKQSFKQIENAAKVWGKEIDVIASKQAILKNRINSMIAQGVDPASRRIKVLKKEFDNLGKGVDQISNNLKMMGALFGTILGTAFVAGIKKSIKAASDLEEQTNKFRVVFSQMGAEAEVVLKDLQENYGLSERAAREMLSSTGNLAKGLNFTQKEALGLSEQINKMAVDITSFTNFAGGTTRASEILTRALLGEREALASLDIKISELDIKQRALAKGMTLVNGQVSRQEKAMITLELIQERASDSTNDFKNSINSWSNQVRVAEATAEDFSAKVGTAIKDSLLDVLPTVSESREEFLRFGESIGVLTAGLIKLIAGLAKFIKTFSLLTPLIKGTIAQINFYADALKEAGVITQELNLQSGKKSFFQGLEESAKQSIPEIKKGTKTIAKEVLNVRQAAIEAAERIRKEYEQMQQNIIQGTLSTLSTLASFGNQLSALIGQQAQNRITILEHETERKQEILNAEREAALEAAGVEEETAAEKQETELLELQNNLERAVTQRERSRIQEQIKLKQDAIKRNKINEEFAKKEAKLAEEADAKRKEIEREAAKRQKQLAIFTTLVEIPTASFQAYRSAQVLPFPASQIVGGILATAATALGFKKLDIIKNTPLPMQSGGLVSPPGINAQIGEGGNQELVAPLTQKIFDMMGQGIINAIANRQEVETPEEATIIEEPEERDISIIINWDSEIIYEGITKASRDGKINIDVRSLVTT
jgi:hypothetical protein